MKTSVLPPDSEITSQTIINKYHWADKALASWVNTGCPDMITRLITKTHPQYGSATQSTVSLQNVLTVNTGLPQEKNKTIFPQTLVRYGYMEMHELGHMSDWDWTWALCCYSTNPL